MIRARGYYRQDRENERRHHDLGEFEGSRKRTAEHVSSNDVDESADHQAEEDRRGEPAHNLFYEMERSGGLPARRRFSVTATAQACEPRRAEPREPPPRRLRSEEHTSELQSLMRISYAVFILKKKTHKQQQ